MTYFSVVLQMFDSIGDHILKAQTFSDCDRIPKLKEVVLVFNDCQITVSVDYVLIERVVSNEGILRRLDPFEAVLIGAEHIGIRVEVPVVIHFADPFALVNDWQMRAEPFGAILDVLLIGQLSP